MSLFEDKNKGAEFSECRRYRYALWRIWDQSAPLAMFIGLNPSRADESKDDPTIKRVTALTRQWGHGGFYMMNLFAFVTPYPDELRNPEARDILNDSWLYSIAKSCGLIIFCWGNFNIARERAKDVIAMFPNAHALHINKNGSPKHPLYVPVKTIPIKFDQ